LYSTIEAVFLHRFFFFHCHAHHRHLHSFPTRRSSDLKPSFKHSWNQSRQVIRLPVQLWKYSWAITDCTRMISASVVYSSSASTHEVLKIFRPLFSIAPILKALVATII